MARSVIIEMHICSFFSPIVLFYMYKTDHDLIFMNQIKSNHKGRGWQWTPVMDLRFKSFPCPGFQSGLLPIFKTSHQHLFVKCEAPCQKEVAGCHWRLATLGQSVDHQAWVKFYGLLPQTRCTLTRCMKVLSVPSQK